jgi:hypothetical protein
MTWQPSEKCKNKNTCVHYKAQNCCVGYHDKDIKDSNRCNLSEWVE